MGTAAETSVQGDEAYKRFVPSGLIELMGLRRLEDVVPGGHVERRMTVMFCDIRDFTLHTQRMSPRDSIGFINSFMGAVDPVIRLGGGTIDKFIGDAVMAVFPVSADDGVDTAVSMISALGRLNLFRGAADRSPIRAGIGLNTGMVIIGAVGDKQRLEATVISGAVNLASRLEDLTKAYGASVLISENVLYSLKVPQKRLIRFLDRVRIKGSTQPQSVYEVFECDPAELRAGKERSRARFEEAAAYYHLRAVDRAEELFSECLGEAPGDEAAKLYLGRCDRYRRYGEHESTGELDGTLEWRDEFAVGVPTIDSQHSELLRQMNRVAPLIRAGDTSGLEKLFAFLGDYAVYHFS